MNGPPRGSLGDTHRAILVRCPSCNGKFRAPDRAHGERVACPDCRHPLAIEGERVPNHDVFISYSSKDKPVADAVCAALESKRVRCWIGIDERKSPK